MFYYIRGARAGQVLGVSVILDFFANLCYNKGITVGWLFYIVSVYLLDVGSPWRGQSMEIWVMVFLMIVAAMAPVIYVWLTQPRAKTPVVDEILLDLLDLEFCPGASWLFDTLYSQRRRLQRLCSRYSAIRKRCKRWQRHILMDAFETADKLLERNIQAILKLCVMAGWEPRLGLYQPDFDKSAINRVELRQLLAENVDCLDKLDKLMGLAIDRGDTSGNVSLNNLDACIAVMEAKSFQDDFTPGMSFGVKVA